MKQEIESVEIYAGIDQDKRGVYLRTDFMATMDGGLHRFLKHFTRLVLFRSKEQFEKFIDENNIGNKVRTKTEGEGTSTAYMIDYS